jgi:two-component system response regulator WspF
MGNDGAAGLLALRKLGWHTIAWDQKSSVAFGMAKAAIELSAADEILP